MRMNRTFARILSLALCLILTVGLLPVSASAKIKDPAFTLSLPRAGEPVNDISVTFAGMGETVTGTVAAVTGGSEYYEYGAEYILTFTVNGEFHPNATATVTANNGSVRDVTSYTQNSSGQNSSGARKTLTVSCRFSPLSGLVSSAAIGFTPPAAGTAVGDFTGVTIGTAGVSLGILSVTQDGAAATTFEMGKTYRFSVPLSAENGYEFADSFTVTVANGTNVSLSGNTVSWEYTVPVNSYKVSFDANGGTGSIADAFIAYGQSYTLPDCTFTAPLGQQFQCWQVGSDTYHSGESISVTADVSVKALWETARFRITFAANGGIGTMESVFVLSGETYQIPACGFIAPTSKRFSGWLVNGEAAAAGTTITVTGDTTLTAQWETICICTEKCKNSSHLNKDCLVCTANTKDCKFNDTSYTVAFDANGGAGTMAAQTGVVGAYILPACTFTAPEGQQFAGWLLNGTTYQVNDIIQVTGPITLTAQWENKPVVTYTVTFEPNGGAGTMAAQTGVVGAYTLPACTFTAPEGQQFAGWLLNGTTYQANDTIQVTGPVTLTAQWENKPVVTYTVTFEANGGSGTMADQTGVVGTYTVPACTFTAPAGMQFAGWLLNGTAYQTNDTIQVTGPVTLTAQWSQVYTVTVQKGGDGKGTVSANPTSGITGTQVQLTATPDGDKSQFTGWSVVSGGVTITGNTFTIGSSDVVITGTFVKTNGKAYNVTVGTAQNGSAAADLAEATEGMQVTLTVSPDPGYRLKSWNVTAGGVTVDESGKFIMGAADVTVTPVFEPIPYTISYDLGGGALAEGVTNPTSYTVESGAITLNNPAKFGYTFLGWTDGNSSEPVTSVTIPAGSTGDRAYTAHWQQVTYSVTGDDYTRNEDNSILFTAQADFSKFETGGKVLVDGSELRRDVDYTAVSGSTKVTLNKSFLDTLSIGEHTLTIQFNDGGKAETKFNVDAVYTVTFDANGGQLKSPATGTVKHGEKLAKPADPTHASMKFNAWYRYEGGIYSLYNFDNPVTVNLELVAQWSNYSSTEYQVTFLYKDDGKTPDLSLRTDVYTCQLPSGSFPADPFRVGYTFEGWYLADDVTGEIQEPGVSVDADYTYTKATKVAAKWEPITYEIKYVANNGADQSKTVSVKYDEVHRVLHGTADCNFDSSGKVFKNWTVTPDGIGSGDAYEAGDEVSKMAVLEGAKFTLYAQWEDAPTYTVAYEANGGSGTMTPDTGVSGSYTIRANGFTAPVGYRFKGWQIGTTAYASGETITVSDNVTITALWEQIPVNPPVTYTVRFDANGGTGTMADMTFTGGEAKNLTQNSFTRSGCTFKGWNTRADGSGTPYADKASVSALSTTDGAVVTLYAQWEENSSGTPGSPNPGGSNSGSSSSGLDYVPKTGDISGLMLWLTIALTSAVALVADIFTRRRAR